MITTLTPIIRRLPSWLYKLGAQAYIDKEFPRHIFIETTATCNLACAYCPREKIKQDMDFQLFKDIVDECSKYGRRSFSLHLFGEPLLYPRILDSIRYIKSKNKRHTVLLTTNGTLLNKFAKELEAIQVDRVIWSWRREAQFDDNSIRLIRKRGLIRLLIEETPREEFEKWSKFPRVEIKHLHNYGGNIDVSKWGLKTEQAFRYPCYHLWLAPAVRWNGDITICCNDPAGLESFGRYGAGNGISVFWRSEHLRRIRESHLKGQYSGICKNCDSWKAYPNMFWGHQCS